MKDKNSLITDVWKYGNSTKSLWIFPLVYSYSPTLLSPDSQPLSLLFIFLKEKITLATFLASESGPPQSGY